MASLVPSKEEIRAFAEAIGAVDEHGNYTASRAKLAKGAVAWRDEVVAERERKELAPETTASQLGRFLAELIDVPVTPAFADQLVLAVAPVLVRSQGLQLKSKESPAHE